MRKILFFAHLLAFGLQIYAQNGLLKNGKDYYLPNTVVVKLKQAPQADVNGNVTLPVDLNKALSPYSVSSAVQKFPEKQNTLYKAGRELNKIVSLTCVSNEDPLVISKKISKMKGVEWAEPKYAREVTYDVNDPNFNQLTQYNLFIIKAKEAWDINRGNKSVIIGIIDTGVYWKHPDLTQNIYQNLNEDADHDGHTIEFNGTNWVLDPGDLNGIDNDGNGYTDDLIGWDFGGTNGVPDNNPEEDSPIHGTLIAGVAGAVTNNGAGIASIGFNCSIMPVKGTRSDMDGHFVIFGFEGIKYAADNGAQIINCSFSGYAYSKAEQEVINYAASKGALVVAAAGNDNIELPSYPSSYDGVLSVAASNALDKIWSATNYGANIDVIAPGQQIYSLWGTDGYKVVNGTSVSSPLAAGLAGLVKNQFPNYTPLQVAEQIRITTDDIYALNADSLRYKLGSGRINAYKALTTNNAVSVRAKNIKFIDEGNQNGIIQKGELVSVEMDFNNYLSPISGFQAVISTANPYVSISNSTFSTGSIATLGSVKNNNNKFYFRINSYVPYNERINFLLTYSGNGYSDFQWISVVVNQTHDVMADNNLVLSIASSGNIGYDDYPNNLQGMGFKYLDSENLLFEGSFMYGTSAAKMVDAARVDSRTQNKDFKTITPFVKKASSLYADSEGYTIFNDDNALTNKLGIETRLIAYSYRNAPNNNYIILRAVLINNSGSDISNLYTGWFLDFDLDESNYNNNVAVYDNVNKFIYAYDPGGNPFRYYVGTALLTEQNLGIFAIDNVLVNNGMEITPDFTKQTKWNMLSGGITKTSAGPEDISIIISAGPINIPANGYQNVSFVLAAGMTLDELKTSIANSRTQYLSIPNDRGADPQEIPQEYRLSQNYPNPFVSFTKILYDLPIDDYVKICVFDILGREVAVLTDGFKSAGKNYVAHFNGNQFPSGIYFYRIETSSFTFTRKMVLIK